MKRPGHERWWQKLTQVGRTGPTARHSRTPSEKGTEKVVTHCSPSSPAGQSMTLRLDGVDRARMFELSYTTKASGSGVGLAISRSIIEAHGGQLWAEESIGRGATFSFTLPAHSAAVVM